MAQAKTGQITGTYEYIYPYNTSDLQENHYIELKENKGRLSGTYYGTSDEFDKGREGYLPGFFKVEMKEISFKNDILEFTITIKSEDIFEKAFTPFDPSKGIKPWIHRAAYPSSTLKYSLKKKGENFVKEGKTSEFRIYVQKK
jgi:hypothetical protein